LFFSHVDVAGGGVRRRDLLMLAQHRFGRRCRWSLFGLERSGLAAMNIALPLLLMAATAYARASRPAALSMSPDAFWVGLATALNGAIGQMNART